MRRVLSLLLESREYARGLGTDHWDFAVEINVLRRLGATNSDLRWMTCEGLVEHAAERYVPDAELRSFRSIGRLTFSRRTCFVLTPCGEEVARRAADSIEATGPAGRRLDLPPAPAAGPGVPSWDGDRQELRLGPLIVKRFKVPAPNQELILAAFQEDMWPSRIDDPLPPRPELEPKRRLHDTINSLNRNQRHRLINFMGDGSGRGVRWEKVEVMVGPAPLGRIEGRGVQRNGSFR